MTASNGYELGEGEVPLDQYDETMPTYETWYPVDLAPVLDAGYTPPAPDLFTTTDGAYALLYRGSINGLHGDSGIGKSWLAYAAVAQVLSPETEGRALIIDYEANAGEVVSRLLALGVLDVDLRSRLTYIAPDEASARNIIDRLIEENLEGVELVVIDSLGEAFGVDGVNEDSDAEVGPWLREVPRRIAAAGPAVLLIDHSTKARDNQLFASGSKRKRAAITGASYLVGARHVPTRDSPGTLTITTAKDRHGHWKRGALAVTADVTPYPDGGVTVKLRKPAASSELEDDRVLIVAKRIVQYVRDEGGGVSISELVRRAPITGATDLKRAAIDYAVRKGAIRQVEGARGAVLHEFVHDITLPTQPDPT